MNLIVGLLQLILILILQISIVGLFWVLRVALNWWLDVDYIAQIDKLIKKLKN